MARLGKRKAFDVALCPFVLNELTRNVNPIKLREYLSAGLPVVSTVPDGPHARIYRDIAAKVRDQLAGRSGKAAAKAASPRLRRGPQQAIAH